MLAARPSDLNASHCKFRDLFERRFASTTRASTGARSYKLKRRSQSERTAGRESRFLRGSWPARNLLHRRASASQPCCSVTARWGPREVVMSLSHSLVRPAPSPGPCRWYESQRSTCFAGRSYSRRSLAAPTLPRRPLVGFDIQRSDPESHRMRRSPARRTLG